MPLKHRSSSIRGLAGAGCASLLRRTVDWRAIYVAPTTDPVHPRHTGCYLYLGWREYLMMPVL